MCVFTQKRALSKNALPKNALVAPQITQIIQLKYVKI